MTDTEALLQDCLNRYDKLNEWEQSFIDTLSSKKDLNSISERQYAQLERIWERIT